MQTNVQKIDDPTRELIALFGHREVAKSYSILSYEAVRMGRAARPIALDEAWRGMLRAAPTATAFPEGEDPLDFRALFGYGTAVRPALQHQVHLVVEAELAAERFADALSRMVKVLAAWMQTAGDAFAGAPIPQQAQLAFRRCFREWAAKLPEKKAIRHAQSLSCAVPTVLDPRSDACVVLKAASAGDVRRVEVHLPVGMNTIAAGAVLRAVRVFAQAAGAAPQTVRDEAPSAADADPLVLAASKMVDRLATALYEAPDAALAAVARDSAAAWEGVDAAEALPLKTSLRVLRWAIEDAGC